MDSSRMMAVPAEPYPAPYFDRSDWMIMRQEVLDSGLQGDEWLPADADVPTFGLNLAIGWPMPPVLQDRYGDLRSRLEGWCESAYVYPYEFTHVTVATLVGFQDHRDPSPSEVTSLMATVPEIVRRLQPLFDAVGPDGMRPFELDVGPPLLGRRAAFLPIVNATGEVRRVREFARTNLRDLDPLSIKTPGIIHSTFLRLVADRPDATALVGEFEARTRACRLGIVPVTEILLTSETKPYMRAGQVLHRFELQS